MATVIRSLVANSNNTSNRKKRIRFAPNVKKMDGFQMKEERYQAFVRILTNQVYEGRLLSLSDLTRTVIIGFLRVTITGGVADDNYDLGDLLQRFRNGHTLPSPYIGIDTDLTNFLNMLIGSQDFVDTFSHVMSNTAVSSSGSEASTPDRNQNRRPGAHERNVIETDFAQLMQETEPRQ